MNLDPFLIKTSLFFVAETVYTSGCGSCALTLTCRHLNSIIAILEVNYSNGSDAVAENCANSTSIGQLMNGLSLRESINHRYQIVLIADK